MVSQADNCWSCLSEIVPPVDCYISYALFVKDLGSFYKLFCADSIPSLLAVEFIGVNDHPAFRLHYNDAGFFIAEQCSSKFYFPIEKEGILRILLNI